MINHLDRQGFYLTSYHNATKGLLKAKHKRSADLIPPSRSNQRPSFASSDSVIRPKWSHPPPRAYKQPPSSSPPSKPKHNQIRYRKKTVSGLEKFDSPMPSNYFNFIKDHKRKPKDLKHSQGLKVGARSIKKVDFTQFVNTTALAFLKNRLPKPRKAKSVSNHATSMKKHSQSSPRVDPEPKQPHEDDHSSSASNQVEQRSLRRMLTEPIRDSRPTRCDMVPVPSNEMRREPFVAGISKRSSHTTVRHNQQLFLLYHDFLWKVNYSNGLYVKPPQQEVAYRAYVGPGNNSDLIKKVIRARGWWVLSNEPDNCQFVWTQLRFGPVLKNQPSSETQLSQLYPEFISQNAQQLRNEATTSGCAHESLFNRLDLANWQHHERNHLRSQAAISDRTYRNRMAFFSYKNIKRVENAQSQAVTNHIPNNYHLGNKKALHKHLQKYAQEHPEASVIAPPTYHIRPLYPHDKEHQKFLQHHFALSQKSKGNRGNLWIVKPGENSNQGTGITVCQTLGEIKSRLRGRQRNKDGSVRTFIVQKYIERPMLYRDRKFDIRHFLLLTCANGVFKAYWFPEGYLRTASATYSLRSPSDQTVHLTNDAVQRRGGQYGKHEKGNKVSYGQFAEYLKEVDGRSWEKVLEEMKDMALVAVKACWGELAGRRPEHNFELLGMDFMLEEDQQPRLIEINTNPCLETNCSLLTRLIGQLLEQTFRLALDPLFPPPKQLTPPRRSHLQRDPLHDNRYQLLFDSSDQAAPPQLPAEEEEWAGELEGEVFESEAEED